MAREVREVWSPRSMVHSLRVERSPRPQLASIANTTVKLDRLGQQIQKHDKKEYPSGKRERGEEPNRIEPGGHTVGDHELHE